MRKALVEMDDEVLTNDRIRILLELMPTQDEKALLDDFCQTEGDVQELAQLDRFLYTLGSVPKSQKRIECLQTEREVYNRVRCPVRYLYNV